MHNFDKQAHHTTCAYPLGCEQDLWMKLWKLWINPPLLSAETYAGWTAA